MTTEQHRAPEPIRTERPSWLLLDRHEDRDVADPAGQTLVDVRPIRDEVERRVLTPMSELGLIPVQTGDRA